MKVVFFGYPDSQDGTRTTSIPSGHKSGNKTPTTAEDRKKKVSHDNGESSTRPQISFPGSAAAGV